ncbi:hypothetical protein LTR10_016914 [Elasticomyces elasticus]|uniref:Zn(2)-C6 fungal-type domain-containing protein n=1 Tax=Exophiala sideris TaxID=1016849 RepID=A0ABR0JFF3_9EURO|nr:hypothetical protein LTR10_016914 [Elasticomyces elasticus]KAK5025168.1 hypothetical protein LTS07_008019 [Exophiala sideris]KAK5029285.1 hypothetical protein LTR13_008822 [Exophiala sideris]KAK5063227.1 hypothetical protein LTR69_003933 [Exophiala sideris]KAK5178943.1 hypothetical protein LTR44_008432 [Eurotiomycetes sp. CCFEE 6388]
MTQLGGKAHGKPRQKAWKPKVKTGCVTCRTRRIKCDEAKPTCARCTSSARKCGGYTDDQNQHDTGLSWQDHSWQHSWTPLAVEVDHPRTSRESQKILAYPQLLVFDSKVEGQAFDFFRSYSVPDLTGLFRVDEDFWHVSVLRMSMTQPAVRYAVTGLGALHQVFSHGDQTVVPDDTSDAQVQFALRQCNRAIKALSANAACQNEPIYQVSMLMTCILFTCYSTLQGNQTQSLMHFRNGLRLLESLERSAKTTGTSATLYDELMKSFVSALSTLENQARTLICDESLPPLATRIRAQEATRGNDGLTFYSLVDARSFFDSLLCDMQCFVQECDTGAEWALVGARPRRSTTDGYRFLVDRSAKGKSAMDNFLARQDPLNDRDQKTVLVLRLHHCLLDMYLAIFRLSPEYGDLVWDCFESSFVTIISLSRQILGCTDKDLYKAISNTVKRRMADNSDSASNSPEDYNIRETGAILPSKGEQPRPVFAFSQGVVGPLYIVAMQCRSPRLRREALAMLLRYPRREGLWDSFSGGRVAFEVMSLEEDMAQKWHASQDGFFQVQSAHDIPAQCRIRDVELVHIAPRLARVRFRTTEEGIRKERGRFEKWMAW